MPHTPRCVRTIYFHQRQRLHCYRVMMSSSTHSLPRRLTLVKCIITSGVFRISVRRGRGAVGVKGSSVAWRGLGTFPQKNFFVPKMISLSAFCCSFQQAENTDTQLKPWDTDFMVQSRNETYKNSAEITQNSRSHQRGAVAPSPAP